MPMLSSFGFESKISNYYMDESADHSKPRAEFDKTYRNLEITNHVTVKAMGLKRSNLNEIPMASQSCYILFPLPNRFSLNHRVIRICCCFHTHATIGNLQMHSCKSQESDFREWAWNLHSTWIIWVLQLINFGTIHQRSCTLFGQGHLVVTISMLWMPLWR